MNNFFSVWNLCQNIWSVLCWSWRDWSFYFKIIKYSRFPRKLKLKTTTNGPHFNFWVKLSFQSVVEFGLVKPNTIKLGEWVILFYCHVSNSFILLFDAAFLLRWTSGIFIVLAHWNNRLQLETDMWLSVVWPNLESSSTVVT